VSTSTPPADGQKPSTDDTQGQKPATGSQTTNQPPPSSDDDAPKNVEEARRLRDELKQRRESEASAKAELKKLQDSLLSEQERAQKRLAELEAEHANHQREMQELRVSQTVERLATKLGIVDPEAATKLMDWSQLEFDKDTGQPTNAESVLKALVKSKSFLVGTPAGNPASISPTNPGAQTGQPFFTRAQIEDLGFFSKNKAAIQQAIMEGRYEK
jgi:type IV secretory pathway VirB10-like protein